MKKLFLTASVMLLCSSVYAVPKTECEKTADKNHRARVKECSTKMQPEKGNCQSESVMTFRADTKACKTAK
jgi:hypothetical protein